MNRTKAELNEEIAALEAMRGKLPNSLFGDDNNKLLEAQLRFLKGEVTYDGTYELEESGQWSEDEGGAARDAGDWLNGHIDMSPSDDWKTIIPESESQ